MDGLKDKYGIIDQIIKTLNTVSVSGAHNVLAIAETFKMLLTLKNGLKDEENAKNKTIELLKDQLKRATTPEQPEDGGDIIGGEHYDLNYGGDDNGGN